MENIQHLNHNRPYDVARRLVNIRDDNGNPIQSQQFGVGNERIALTDYVSNQTTYFNGPTEYTEYGGNGTLAWSRSLVYFGDSILSTITPNGQNGEYVEFNHPDRLGTKVITNQAGGTSYEQATLPFGKALNAESTVTTYSKRFTSSERSARTGLDYAQNRTYDAKQGRFTQVDPIGMGDSSFASPQSFNLYTYCQNDPVNNVDPSGLGFFSFLKKLFKWIVAAIAVIVAVLTIVAAPATIAGILAAISAGAAAGSSVMNALGYTTAAKVLGWIAIATGIGAGIGAMGKANQSLIIKNFASTAEKTTSIWQRIMGGISAVGAISNSLVDGKPKKKRRPGIFQTVDQAAKWWLRIMNPHSIKINREIAVPICERTRDGAIIFGPYDIGTNAGSTVNGCPTGTKMVASAHTHGAYDPNYDNENFSTDPGDRLNANNRSVQAGGSVPNYVGTPSGVIRKFKPAGIAGSTRGKVITFKTKTATVLP